MAIKPYLNKVGLTNLWANIKAYVTSKVPTKVSELTNDSGYITGVSWDNVTGKPSTFAPSSHTHDDRYYTETEINTKLSGKANTSGTYSSLTVGSATKADSLCTANGSHIVQNDVNFYAYDNNRKVFVWISNGSASYFYGQADKATQDASGNVINTTYATKSENALKANDASVVHTSGDETIGGNKTFSSQIKGDISGTNATFTNTVRSVKVQATDDLGLVLANKDSTSPTTTSGWNQVQFYDKNMVQLGYFQLSSNTNANVYNWVGRKNANLADWRNIFWNVDADVFGCDPSNTVSLGRSSNRWSQLHCTEITTYAPNFQRNIYGDYGTFWRQDVTNLYLLLTASGDQNGGWTSARPIIVNLSTGKCYINGVCPSDNVLAVCLINVAVGNLVAGTNLRVARGVVGGTFTYTEVILTGTYRALSIVDANGVGLFEKLA